MIGSSAAPKMQNPRSANPFRTEAFSCSSQQTCVLAAYTAEKNDTNTHSAGSKGYHIFFHARSFAWGALFLPQQKFCFSKLNMPPDDRTQGPGGTYIYIKTRVTTFRRVRVKKEIVKFTRKFIRNPPYVPSNSDNMNRQSKCYIFYRYSSMHLRLRQSTVGEVTFGGSFHVGVGYVGITCAGEPPCFFCGLGLSCCFNVLRHKSKRWDAKLCFDEQAA